MLLAFTEGGWEDYQFWQDTDKKVVGRINDLLNDTLRHPFAGLGKPEPLKGAFKGFWSRRITHEHRLIYRMVGSGENQTLVVAQCRFHY